MAGQLLDYRCHSLLSQQDTYVYYIQILDSSNTIVFFIWELLTPIYDVLMICSLELNEHVSHRRNAAIMELVCHLLAGKDRGNLQTYCPQFCDNQIHPFSLLGPS